MLGRALPLPRDRGTYYATYISYCRQKAKLLLVVLAGFTFFILGDGLSAASLKGVDQKCKKEPARLAFQQLNRHRPPWHVNSMGSDFGLNVPLGNNKVLCR
jgi:hypothetical protein